MGYFSYVCMYVGRVCVLVRVAVAPIFVSYLPLSIWIWDIPFSGRFICSSFHDDRVILYPGYPLRTKYFYLLGSLIYCMFVVLLLYKHQKLGEKKKTESAFS
jgi:hypothetical protein